MRYAQLVAAMYCGLLLSACAAGNGAADTSRTSGPQVYSDCFFPGTITDWRALDNRNLVIYAAGRRPYHILLATPSMNLRFAQDIGLSDRDGRICPYGGDSIIVGGAVTDRIPIASIRRLTDEQLVDLLLEFGIRRPEIIPEPEVEIE
jgi:hypothetical protein